MNTVQDLLRDFQRMFPTLPVPELPLDSDGSVMEEKIPTDTLSRLSCVVGMWGLDNLHNKRVSLAELGIQSDRTKLEDWRTRELEQATALYKTSKNPDSYSKRVNQIEALYLKELGLLNKNKEFWYRQAYISTLVAQVLQ